MSRSLLRRCVVSLLLAVLAVLGSCESSVVSALGKVGTQPFTMPSEEVPGVGNFAKVSEVLYRGAQPDEEGFANLKKMGIKTVIDLRSWHSDKEKLKGTGLRYLHIPCAADQIDQEDIAQVIKVVRDPANQPVFVHCQHGSDRTGLAVGIYRIVEQGWTADQAEDELRAFGYHTVYRHILETMRLLSTRHFNDLVEKTAMPKVEVVK